MDMVISTPYIPKKGETITGNNFFLNGGGKGANQAVAVAKQNAKVYMIGNVGNDVFGNELLQNLNNYNVDTSHLCTLKNSSTGVAMIILCNNDNRIILDGGANHNISFSQIDEALKNAKENDIFISQLENNLDSIVYGYKKAKERKMITIFNPAPAKELDSNIFKFIDYLVLNETECKILTGLSPKNNTIIKEIYQKLKVETLIITLGSKGSLLIKKDSIKKIKAEKINPIDTTAAGDTYVGVFASQLIKNKAEIEALQYASIASALTCLKEGAQKSIPYESEVLNYIKNKYVLKNKMH